MAWQLFPEWEHFIPNLGIFHSHSGNNWRVAHFADSKAILAQHPSI